MKIRKELWMFMTFPVSHLLIIWGYYETLGRFSAVGYLGILLGIAADVILFYVLVRGSRKEKLEKELEELKYLREMERIRRESDEEREEQLFKMRENFADQMKDISEKLESGEKLYAKQEIEGLQEQLNATGISNYCQNPVINAVLSEKQNVCSHLGFQMDIHLMILKKIQAEALHICSVFSNLTDNAIEAVEELEEQERFIEITAEAKGVYLFIKVKNPAKKEHVFREKRSGHGYGTQILESIAEQYEGEYKTSYEKDGCFTAVMVLKAFECK